MNLEEEIHRRIRERGRITFAEFMELTLFWPAGGYYRAENPIGSSGDYYTSPHVHPAFGSLLAVQLFQFWQLLGRPDPFTVLELGAGDGTLCLDVVEWGKALPVPFGRALRYVCVDLQKAPGVEAGPAGGADRGVSRVAAAAPPFRKFKGCLVSNEFLDSLPVHQVTKRNGRLQEVYVSAADEGLAPSLGEPSDPALASRFESLGIDLTEGQTAEISLGLDSQVQKAVQCLEAGFILNVDYGHLAAELYSPERRYRGTLTTYYRHVQTDAPFNRIGKQDITAQVDFTSVISAGRRAGLETLGLTSQRRFLKNLGLDRLLERLRTLHISQKIKDANRAGMLDLVRPGGLGGFKALVQSKGAAAPNIWGLEPSPEAQALAGELPVPLLTSRHLRWLEGRYPASDLEFEV